MPLTIGTNIASLTAQRSMMESSNALQSSFERLASGKRINAAVDDAAGLAVSDRLTSRINGMNQAIRNTNDGVSMVQIAEGALDEATTILQRMRDLAVQSANGSMSDDDRDNIAAEVTALGNAIDDVQAAANFGGVALLDATGNITIQIGAMNGETLNVAKAHVDSAALSVNSLTLDSTAAAADFASAITTIDAALASVASSRASFGSSQAQLESQVRNLTNVVENTSAARSRVLDTDYAAETANLTKNQILQQASTSILAQANQQPQSVLALLQ